MSNTHPIVTNHNWNL